MGYEYAFPGWKGDEALVALLLDGEEEEEDEEEEEEEEVLWVGCFVCSEGMKGDGRSEEKGVEVDDVDGERGV